jgi:hypothetical protein
MSTKPRRSDDASPRQSTGDPSRRVASPVRQKPTRTSSPGILDAVCDQHGDRWVQYGTRERAIWFAVADLISVAPHVFRRLSSVGGTHLTASSQSAFKREVEARSNFRPALVATQPGWLESSYIFGDGKLAAPRSDDREVIVAFEPNSKFTRTGSLLEWQAAVAPFASGQPLPFFALALAFTGPLLRFAPPGYTNPQVEIVGKGETGKTSVGVLAGSIWAGNPDSDCGGGELWDMTLNALDPVKLAHRDSLLFLDEGNLAGASAKDRREFVQKAVFKLATTGGKRRMGDVGQSEHAHLALLSTTNTALADLLDGSAEVRDAAQSRMITIRIASGDSHGVFARVPANYTTAREACEAMRAAADHLFGTAGHGFIERLVRQIEVDEALLRRVIARSLATYMLKDRAPKGSARVQKTFALVAVAAALAQRWGIMPKPWGSPMAMVQEVAQIASSESFVASDPLEVIRAYVKQHRKLFVEVAGMAGPMQRDEFEAANGFLRRSGGYEEALIPARRFQAIFPDYEKMMRALRDRGPAQTEGGLKPKLTIKTPRVISHEGRVYCVSLRSEGAASTA